MGEIIDFPLVVLAAGKGSRAGSPKGLIEILGKPWILWLCDSFLGTGGLHVIVVLGPDRERYRQTLDEHYSLSADRRNPMIDLRFAYNDDPDRGQFSSIKIALDEVLKGSFPGCLLLPVDCCFPTSAVTSTLINELIDPVLACIPVFENKGGHPLLIARKLALALSSDPFFKRINRLDLALRLLAEDQLKRVPVEDPFVVTNLNNKSDWTEFSKRFEPVQQLQNR